jgi:hypothetical protein
VHRSAGPAMSLARVSLHVFLRKAVFTILEKFCCEVVFTGFSVLDKLSEEIFEVDFVVKYFNNYYFNNVFNDEFIILFRKLHVMRYILLITIVFMRLVTMRLICVHIALSMMLPLVVFCQ